MCDEWMSLLKLTLTLEQFHQLPRNAAYKYEYLDGQAWLTPRPKHFHAVLDLQTAAGEETQDIHLRPLRVADLADLEPVFARAFHQVQPFGSLDDRVRKLAAHKCLEKTLEGGDGPLVEQASFVAVPGEESRAGAILVTLLPEGDPLDDNSYYWNQPPPADYVQQHRGRPHLTWIFVDPEYRRQGVATALLKAARRELLGLGYTQMLSTFLCGNDASTLWHWRRGFQLLSDPWSLSRWRKTLRKEKGQE
jgi:GNAT superfamily N-acetyltransferase